MSTDTHPAATPAIASLNTLARWTPANAGELARILAALHQYDANTVVSALHDTLEHLADTLPRIPDLTAQQRELAATWLGRAAERLGFTSEALDQARLATGAEWTR